MKRGLKPQDAREPCASAVMSRREHPDEEGTETESACAAPGAAHDAAESTPMKRGLKQDWRAGRGLGPATCRREHPDEEGTETPHWHPLPRAKSGRREHPDEEGTETT